jgi:hypothetical protein
MPTIKSLRLFSFLLLAAAAAGCSSEKSNSPSAPSAFVLTGVWTADVAFQGITGRMTWTLQQQDTAVSGPVLLALPTGAVLMNGVLQGTRAGSLLTYSIAVGPGNIPNQPSCTGTLSGTMTINSTGTPTMVGPLGVAASTCTIQFQTTNLTFTRTSTVVALQRMLHLS